MAKFEIIMPKLGESIIEATITKWLKSAGDVVEEDDAIVEIATDKVDSEIPSPIEGKILKTLYEEGDVVAVGKVIAIVEMDGDEDSNNDSNENTEADIKTSEIEIEKAAENLEVTIEEISNQEQADFTKSDRFYSPLVKSIAKTENISLQELDSIQGSGKEGRVTKQDVFQYLENKPSNTISSAQTALTTIDKPTIPTSTGDRIEEMDRMRKMIADHMVMSKQVSPHVTSFIEVDVTSIVNWRSRVKAGFMQKEGEKITFTPIFIDAAAKALRDHPGVNVSVDGTKIIYRKNINIGMAAALPNGNLIVPVIKRADEKNLVGLAKEVNDLAARARSNKLKPDDISGGTFTITNFGSFDSLTGTPIINQPQAAILGVGAIKKRPVVIETAEGDMIGIRSIMILSLAYDHRVVDGALGGMYLRSMRNYLEAFDTNQNL
ncbi:MAG: 2-oxo acid dehydrogenase subunit E2 [Bacteroidales bacterium]|nr:2-oxo acid dehydrogenase subunit E2 [Bacteroidales bacterium]